MVLCNVVPMKASHLLLGRPWQFDKKTSHEGCSNKYSFIHHRQKIIPVPLSPSEVREDQKNFFWISFDVFHELNVFGLIFNCFKIVLTFQKS